MTQRKQPLVIIGRPKKLICLLRHIADVETPIAWTHRAIIWTYKYKKFYRDSHIATLTRTHTPNDPVGDVSFLTEKIVAHSIDCMGKFEPAI